MLEASVIIAFYKKINYLKLVLAGFKRQTFKNFEIIIADDGSSAEVVNEIKSIIQNSDLSIRHVWHEDNGWRKNKILNKAVKNASADYLIFIDGDCIPHKNFIKEHQYNREKGIILSGRRLNLSKKISDSLSEKLVRDGYLERKIVSWLMKGLVKEFSHAEKGLYLPFLRPILKLKKKELLGCNFSVFKEDLYKINGFDERYLAPTIGEDTDIEFRAGLAGLKIKSVRNLAVQYHLYHHLLTRDNNNYLIFEETKRNRISFTPYGLLRENPDEL